MKVKFSLTIAWEGDTLSYDAELENLAEPGQPIAYPELSAAVTKVLRDLEHAPPPRTTRPSTGVRFDN